MHVLCTRLNGLSHFGNILQWKNIVDEYTDVVCAEALKSLLSFWFSFPVAQVPVFCMQTYFSCRKKNCEVDLILIGKSWFWLFVRK